MRKVIDTEKLPIKMWLKDIEDGAFLQVKNLADWRGRRSSGVFTKQTLWIAPNAGER